MAKRRLDIFYGSIVLVEPSVKAADVAYPLREAVAPGVTVNRYGHDWVIGNVRRHGSDELVSGRLGYPGEGEELETVYDGETQQFLERAIAISQSPSAAFVLRYTDGQLSFEGHDDIGPTGFINHLVAILNQTGYGRFRGELAREETTYREFVASVDKVTRVTFDVHPTNPRDEPIFRPLDEGMQAANATRQRVTIENPDEGLRIDPPASSEEDTENPVEMGIEMVEAGFGSGPGYRIDAVKGDRSVRYESRTRTAVVHDEVRDPPEGHAPRTNLLRRWLKRRRPPQRR